MSLRNSLKLGKIAGIEIGIHYTWVLALLIITWSLAEGVFPIALPREAISTYWVMGILAALMLFVSVLLHELAHSLVAKARGINVAGITLFIFGGVSNLEKEPEKPSVEFIMAIAGPLTSLLLAGVFWGIATLAEQFSHTGYLASQPKAFLDYLVLMNLLLGVFNLIPAFPLDGGRVLRAIIWGSTHNLIRSTNIAAWVGRVFGWAMIAYGLFEVVSRNFVGGMWIAFIGWFVSSAANAGRKQVTLQEHLSGRKVKDIMETNTVPVSPSTTVGQLVQNIFLERRRRAVPVTTDGRLIGMVTISDVKKLPKERWPYTSIDAIMTPLPLFSVSPEDDLTEAMRLITRHDVNQLVVIRNDELIGIISRYDIIHHMQMARELGVPLLPGKS